MPSNPVQTALQELAAVLTAAAPDESNIRKTMQCISVIRDDMARDTSSIGSIHPGDGLGESKATGGHFILEFPEPAGRESARLVEGIITQANTPHDWREAAKAYPEFYRKRRGHNPCRVKNQKRIDAGYVHIAVRDDEAGLFARKIEHMIDRLRTHSDQVTQLIHFIEEHGPRLQNGELGRIEPFIHRLMGKKPLVGMHIDVATTQLGAIEKLNNLGIDMTNGFSSFCPRDDSEKSINAMRYTATIDQSRAIDPVLGNMR